MNITSKSRYGLKIMIDLAQVHASEVHHAQRADIAERQGIPLDYMDHILSRLREAGLILSIRGRGGGYRLAQAAAAISVWEIFSAVEDAIQPVQCLEGGTACMVEHVCGSKDAWSEISNAIKASLSGILLSDIVAKRKSHGHVSGATAADAAGVAPGALAAAQEMLALAKVQECRAPKKRAGGLSL